MYLVATTNNLLPTRARLARKIRITKKVLGNKGAKRVIAMDSPAVGANANIIKIEKKDISQIEYYIYHRKGHYSNKCPQNRNIESKN